MRTPVRVVMVLAASVGLGSVIVAQETVVRVQGWSVSVPARLECAKPPTLSVNGAGSVFDNAQAVQELTAALAQVVRGQCVGMAEVVLQSGNRRRVVTLPAGSATPPPVAPTVAPVPGAAAASPPPSAAPAVLPVVPQPRRAAAPPAAAATSPTPASAPAPAPPAVVAPVAAPSAVLPYSDRPLRAVDSVRRTEDKCEVILEWLGRTATEFTDQNRMPAVQQQRRLLLYRDEDFAAVFGKPFDQTTQKWRTDIHDDVMKPCMGFARPRNGALGTLGRIGGLRLPPARPLTEYAQRFAAVRDLIDGPFLGQLGPYSPDAVTAAIVEGRRARGRLNASIDEAVRAPASFDSFRGLASAVAEASRPEPALWPSEQTHWRQALEARRAEIAGAAAEAWVAGLSRSGNTLDDARRIDAEHRERSELFAAAGAARAATLTTAVDTRLAAVLEPLVARRVAELDGIPATLQGADQVATWKQAFDTDFAPFRERRVVAAADDTYAAAWRRVFGAAVPEWKALLAETDEAAMPGPTARMSRWFEKGAVDGDVRGEYARALADTVEIHNQRRYTAAASRCDALASHPADPEAHAAGVEDDALDSAGAIAACEPATKLTDAPPRLWFQLARAYLKDGRVDEAADLLVTAAGEGHGGALAYLADLHVEGTDSIDADPATAFALYERAVEAGFGPAKAVLAEFEDLTAEAEAADREEAEFLAANPAAAAALAARNKPFNQPSIVTNILNGDLDKVPTGEVYTKAYLLDMAENIEAVCETHFTKAQINQLRMNAVFNSTELTAEAGLNALMGVLTGLAANPGAMIAQAAQAEMENEQRPELAMDDAFLLIEQYSCAAPEIEDFSANLVAYVTNQNATRVSNNELWATCQRDARPTGPYRGADFCQCFLGVLATSPVSRADRQALSTSFWPTAQRLMAEDPLLSPCQTGIKR